MADTEEREFISPPIDEEPDTETEEESISTARRSGILEATGAIELDDTMPLAATADAFAVQSLAALAADWGIGPLRISASVSGGTVSVTVTLSGVRIGGAKLSVAKPSFKVSANVALAKAELEVAADFKRNALLVKGKVCIRVPKLGIPPFKWKCRKFHVTILRW
jgi:hypothetical protein